MKTYRYFTISSFAAITEVNENRSRDRMSSFANKVKQKSKFVLFDCNEKPVEKVVAELRDSSEFACSGHYGLPQSSFVPIPFFVFLLATKKKTTKFTNFSLSAVFCSICDLSDHSCSTLSADPGNSK
jgi:hypothetical protein